MLTRPLKACNELKKFRFADAGLGDYGVEGRLTFGECAGVVYDEHIDFAGRFQGLSIPNQYARPCPAPGSDHNRHRRSHLESTRTGDDKDRDCIDQSVGEAWLRTHQIPDCERRDSGNDDSRNKERSYAVGETLNGSTGTLCLAYQLYNLREESVRTDPFSSHHEATSSVYGAPGHLCRYFLLDGDRFAANHRLIHRTVAFEQHTVYRNRHSSAATCHSVASFGDSARRRCRRAAGTFLIRITVWFGVEFAPASCGTERIGHAFVVAGSGCFRRIDGHSTNRISHFALILFRGTASHTVLLFLSADAAAGLVLQLAPFAGAISASVFCTDTANGR